VLWAAGVPLGLAPSLEETFVDDFKMPSHAANHHYVVSPG
jgi:hypothetical protein